MSFQDKVFWTSKGVGHATNDDAVFDTTPRIEAKHSRQWFLDTESELFPRKKQAVEAPINKLESGIMMSSAVPWEISSGFQSVQSVPSQFMDRLFGSETSRPVDLDKRNMSNVGMDNINMKKNITDDQFENDSAVGLSISYAMDDHEAEVSYGGIRKVKVNQVKDPVSGSGESYGHDMGMSIRETYNRHGENTFINVGQPYGKADGNVTLMGHSYEVEDANIRSIGSIFGKGIENTIHHSYDKGDTNTISFSGYQDESVIEALTRPINSYSLLFEQPSVQTLDTQSKKEVDTRNDNTVVSTSLASKSQINSASKSKLDTRSTRKEAPNSFPSNVRSLMATGMLDGVPVRYIAVSREELHGTIKGSGYLCGCQSCDYSKALNAYEFERHANCKTKHPNNHIYFENGKTIYQIVHELRNTPESRLFDAVQTVSGSPINQKAFRVWKESFQAATRELQRIYGKDELNL